MIVVGPLALVLALGAVAAPPPEVTGLQIGVAVSRLREWQPGITVTFVPPLASLPRGSEPELAVAAGVTIVKDGTVAELAVAAGVPPLVGLDRGAAAALARRHGLVPAVTPLETSRLWTVRTQDPPADTLVAPGSRVSIVVGPPQSPSPSAVPTTPAAPTTPSVVAAEPPVPFPAATVLVSTGLGLVVLMLLLVAGLLLRRGPRTLAAADVTLQPYPGRTVGPALTELGGPSLSVRLVPHRRAGTQHVEEVGP